MSPPASPAVRYALRGPRLVVAAQTISSSRPGALYRDTLLGRFTWYVRQTNGTDRVLRIGLALSNPGPFTVVVRSLRVAARADGVRYASSLRPERVVLGPGTHVLWAVPVAPGGTATLTAQAEASFPERGLDALLDRLGLAAPVVATLYSAPVQPAQPARLAVLPLSHGGIRATFPHAYAVAAGPRPPAPLVPPLLRTLFDPWPAGTDMVDGRTVFDRHLLGVRTLPARAPGSGKPAPSRRAR